jgi:hypothetical protein
MYVFLNQFLTVDKCVESGKDIEPRTVALFVNEIGTFRESKDGRAQSNAELATALRNNGYTVTIIYVGTSSSSFSALARKYAENGISLRRYIS